MCIKAEMLENVYKVVLATFKDLSAERLPSECIQSRYIARTAFSSKKLSAVMLSV